MQNQESWWNRENWKRKWRWNKNAGNKDVYSVSAFITQMYAGTVCSQRKSLESWLLRSWTRRMNSAFWADPNFDNCLLLLILVCFWLWLQTISCFPLLGPISAQLQTCESCGGEPEYAHTLPSAELLLRSIAVFPVQALTGSWGNSGIWEKANL